MWNMLGQTGQQFLLELWPWAAFQPAHAANLRLGWVRPSVEISAQAGILAGQGDCRTSSSVPVLPSCPRAIVFVVDSVAFQREVKDVAEFLYQVLVDSTVLRNAPPLLIACNKQGTRLLWSWAWPILQARASCHSCWTWGVAFQQKEGWDLGLNSAGVFGAPPGRAAALWVV